MSHSPSPSPSSSLSSLVGTHVIPLLVRSWRKLEVYLPPKQTQQAVSAFTSVQSFLSSQFSAHPWFLPLLLASLFLALATITFWVSLVLLLVWPFLLTLSGVILLNGLAASIIVRQKDLVEHNYVRLYVGFMCQLACIIPVIVMGPALIWFGLLATTYQCMTSGKTHPIIIIPLVFLLLSAPYWSLCFWCTAWLCHIMYFMGQGVVFAAYLIHHAATWWKSRSATQQRKQQQQQQQQQQSSRSQMTPDKTSTPVKNSAEADKSALVPSMTKQAAPMLSTPTLTPTPTPAPIASSTPIKSAANRFPAASPASDQTVASVPASASASASTAADSATATATAAGSTTSASTSAPPSPTHHLKENELKRREDGTLVDSDGHVHHVSVAGEEEEMREPEQEQIEIAAPTQNTTHARTHTHSLHTHSHTHPHPHPHPHSHVSDVVHGMESLKITPQTHTQEAH